MTTGSRKTRRGVTLVELMVVVAIVSILMIAVGTVLVGSQNSWNSMYKRTYSGPVIESLIVSKEFDRAVRKATVKQCDVDGVANPTSGTLGTSSLRVYYYKNPATSVDYDGYTEFVKVDSTLQVREGDALKVAGVYGPAGDPITRTLAYDVQSCEFRVPGSSVEMVLRLDASQNTDVKDGNVKMTVTCSAVRHNL